MGARRVAPVLFLASGVIALLVWWLVYTQRVVTDLRREAARSSQMYARVYQALSQEGDDGTAALLDLSRYIRQAGVPVIVTNSSGLPTASANLPFEAPIESQRVRDYVAVLDRANVPISQPGVGNVHYGDTPLVEGLRVVPIITVVTLGLFLLAGVYALVTRGRAERERVFAGMAREAAHQLGTPLTALAGWIELLAERSGGTTGTVETAVGHMRSDLDRLERVAHRFERIGRPAQKDKVDVREIVFRVASYFRVRVPTLTHTVTINATLPDDPLHVEGDAVLLEWALESLVRNGIDALAGRGGRVDLRVDPLPEGGARVIIADDGPGVPRELRNEIFKAGFTTKPRGWGIGLALARRIIMDNHGGRLLLLPTDRGAAFEIMLER
ncbi:MAG TPA: HAMP domain-containing sensor histidine kinase [Gemmatimonadaceae bacterium]|nr:HAMP domain-containing sensor histidine kinase [Gemmatimonadaceae bacterium]